jgi:hypothetical protein
LPRQSTGSTRQIDGIDGIECDPSADLHWNSPAFGEPVDSLLREIVKLGGEGILDRSPWREKLSDLWPRWSRSEAKAAEIAAMVGPLTQLRDRLKQEAGERGWDSS